jgi:hypothetical protein
VKKSRFIRAKANPDPEMDIKVLKNSNSCSPMQEEIKSTCKEAANDLHRSSVMIEDAVEDLVTTFLICRLFEKLDRFTTEIFFGGL